MSPTATPTGQPQSPTAITVSTLPIVPDTSTSSTGVYVGEDCGPNAIVSCANFASAFRHGEAVGNTYAGWDADLAKFASAQGFAAMWASQTVPMITWQPSSTKSTITYAGIIAGNYDTYLRTSADELRALNMPILLRPFHEFNGSWYSWGLANQGASSTADAQFIAAWQHMVSIFRAEGATNVKFVWCYNNVSVPRTAPWNNPAVAYPGDNYVDWIAWDMYNHGSATSGLRWYTFDQLMKNPYPLAVSISPNKPLMISELASNEDGDGGTMKAGWISQMLSDLQQPAATNPYPHLRALLWFQSDSKTYSYDNESTAPAYSAWVNGLRTVDASGNLNFRSNGVELSQLTAP